MPNGGDPVPSDSLAPAILVPTGPANPAARDSATGPWWTCPLWCRGDCTGGEAECLGDGQTAVTGRLHERVLADVTCADYRQMRVRVIVERCDNPGIAGVEQVVLYVEREPRARDLEADQVAELTAGLSDEACRRQLALVMAGAYDSVALELSPQLRRTIAAALTEIDEPARRGMPFR